MTWLSLAIASIGFISCYFLGRQHEWEDQQHQRDERLDGVEQDIAGLIFQNFVLQIQAKQKIEQNMRLRQVCLAQRLKEIKERSA
jgi:hypothetical protein